MRQGSPALLSTECVAAPRQIDNRAHDRNSPLAAVSSQLVRYFRLVRQPAEARFGDQCLDLVLIGHDGGTVEHRSRGVRC